MLKPTVRNLYQLMSVQAELHNPRAARYYSYDRTCKFLLVKSQGNIFKVNLIRLLPENAYTISIVKDCVVQTYARIPRYDETKVYKGGIQVNN